MIKKIYNCFLTSSGVSIDTRTLKRGELFFALSGPNFDGNRYAKEALDKGAKAVIVDKDVGINSNVFIVEDVLDTLQKLSNHHRNQVKAKFIAVTGSNGKTTTKELLREVLSKKYKTQATISNLNNHIGVPLTLLSIKKETEVAIIEMGANHQKEIEVLCLIAEPDFGLITNIGKAHLEGFGGVEGVAKGKLEMFDYIKKQKKVFFANYEDQKIKRATLDYQNTNSYRISEFINVQRSLDGALKFTYDGQNFTTNLNGEYNLINIAAALKVGEEFKVLKDDMLDAIACYQPTNNRSQNQKTEFNDLVLDHYNANPSSMEASLRSFSKIKFDNKLVILGEMGELGDSSEEEHLKLIELVSSIGYKKAIFIGSKYNPKRVANLGFSFVVNNEELISQLDKKRIKAHLILLKGSRTSKLEALIPFL